MSETSKAERTAGHTPTPWEAEIYGMNDGRGRVYVVGPDGWDKTPVCCCYENDSRNINEANAAFIVRAANAHDDLVAALEMVQEQLIGHMTGAWPGTMSITARRVNDAITAALAKASA